MSLINKEDAIEIVERAKEGIMLTFPIIMKDLPGLDIKSAMSGTEAAYNSVIDLLDMQSVEE